MSIAGLEMLSFHLVIAVVINMFRLPDLLTGENILARLDQAILEVSDKPEKTQLTSAIGTLF
jgi:hypothetical protein